MFLKEYALSNIWISGAIVSLAIPLVFAIWFHSIFKPDYRPGHRSMPFIWFPLVSSVNKNGRNAPLLSSFYNVQALYGMCKLLEHQKILSFKVFGRVWVFLFTPESAEVVLGSSKLVEKSSDYKGLKPMLKEGLVTSNGEKWKQRRRLLTPTFHFKILQDFTPLMQDTCKSIVAELETYVDEPWVEVGQIMKNFCCVVLLKTVLGLDLELTSEEQYRLVKNANEYIYKKSMNNKISSAFGDRKEKPGLYLRVIRYILCYNARLAKPWLSSDTLFRMSSLYEKTYKSANVVHNFLREVIREKKNKLLATRNMIFENGIKSNGHFADGVAGKEDNDENFKQRKPFMDLLLEHHFKDSSFTEEDILDESAPFFGAGSVTLGTTITYILYCIGLYPDVQKNIHNELDEIFQDSDRDMKERDLRSMKYLECVIKESLRIYSLPFFSRNATESFKVYDYTVPKGSTVVIFNYAIQRDPKIYPTPEKFDPSRFSQENCVGRHPYAYLPFSAGPRNCIGQRFAFLETKTMVAAVLRKFHVYSLDDRQKLYDMSNISSTETDIPVRIRFSLRDKVAKV